MESPAEHHSMHLTFIYWRMASIVGYAALGSFGLLLVATKLTASIPNLPGRGCVYKVTESQWIKIALQNPELDIDGKHYLCETRDLTGPFPTHML